MTELNQVKVDNWGVYFLQRLKHFFNRTDYCDLTLQFQDNAQLKVHRLVLSACTEYFELLERTCEMYEDCLVMPDDLQADVVVPIINFMYTGQLEFKVELLEKLFQTSQIMNMPVLSKLLDAQRQQFITAPMPVFNNSPVKRYSKVDNIQRKVQTVQRDKPSTSTTTKRSYEKAFDPIDVQYLPAKNKNPQKPGESVNTSQKFFEPRPTRYELPEELDTDNIFDNSFSNISYTSKPLVVHPETIKRYGTKKNNLFLDQKFRPSSTFDIVECKKISNDDDMNISSICDDRDIFGNVSYRNVNAKDSNQLFDQILDNTHEIDEVPKLTVETQNKHDKLDHAKIISQVLKKYPHLMKSNKNIKLKILNTSNKSKKSKTKVKEEEQSRMTSTGFTFESDVLNSKEAAKLIALGAENVAGPWICLICGTPGRAIHFVSYYKFRRHLVEVHNEKPKLNMCEYCGLKSNKRNCLLHHLYTQHNVKPPPQYHFPKCNICSYIALTQGLLVKHKLSHSENKIFRCVVCSAGFSHSNKLLDHIRKTGHKFTSNRNKSNVQCIYCMKMFLKESNLYAHLKVNHKLKAVKDGIIDDSDDESSDMITGIKSENTSKKNVTQFEVELDPQFDEMETQYEIEEKSGKIQIVTKRHASTPKQKILNPGFRANFQKTTKDRTSQNTANVQNEFLEDYNVQSSDEEIVMINDNEYIMKGNQLIERKKTHKNNYNITEIIHPNTDQTVDASCMQYTHIYDTNPEEKSKTILKEQNVDQSIQFVMSGNEDYKTLMSSNQSVIFGDNEDTKTLTVLTAPHATSTMNASTIDLDNTQSNEMMIVPEGYPLNVSEAVVSADNSNIVVVYSHPIDNQSKQYQFITTQNLGAQFVQTSAVLTPSNFEAVTTATPIVTNDQVINVPMDNNWQSNIQETIENAQIEIALTPVDNVDELPHVQLKKPQTVIVRNPNEELLNQQTDSSGNVTEVNEQPITQGSVDSATLIEAGSSAEVVADNISNISEAGETNVININQESDKIIHCTNKELQDNGNKDIVPKLVFEDTEEFVDQNETIIENNETMIESNETMIESNETMIESSETIIESSETIIEGNETIIETNESIIESNESIIESNETIIENSENVIENNEDVSMEEHKENDGTTVDEVVNKTVISEDLVIGEITKEAPRHSENENVSVVKEKIQNLASEWSEDEVEEEGITHESEKQTSMETEDIEESVENIQQEVQRHMNESLQDKSEIVNSNKDALSLKDKEETFPKETITKKPVSLEKISSLLNDWDENDSQEACPEALPKDEVDETKLSEPVETIKNNSATEELQVEATVCQKDNIKILVSDWDDDEENKNVVEEK